MKVTAIKHNLKKSTRQGDSLNPTPRWPHVNTRWSHSPCNTPLIYSFLRQVLRMLCVCSHWETTQSDMLVGVTVRAESAWLFSCLLIHTNRPTMQFMRRRGAAPPAERARAHSFPAVRSRALLLTSWTFHAHFPLNLHPCKLFSKEWPTMHRLVTLEMWEDKVKKLFFFFFCACH